jgi:hypothetical protein
MIPVSAIINISIKQAHKIEVKINLRGVNCGGY